MIIRDATADDIPPITDIYNEVVANTTAIYDQVASTLEERLAWFHSRREAGYPVLVAEEAGEVVGFSALGPWRPRWGYRHTTEHSIHVRADRRGQGLGRALVEALFPLARARDFHMMIGHIDAEMTASLALHEKLGFRQIGRFPQVAHKFGRWLDLVAVQKQVD